jgi:hypothetical protein
MGGRKHLAGRATDRDAGQTLFTGHEADTKNARFRLGRRMKVKWC